jgi:hypothetical protein
VPHHHDEMVNAPNDLLHGLSHVFLLPSDRSIHASDWMARAR